MSLNLLDHAADETGDVEEGPEQLVLVERGDETALRLGRIDGIVRVDPSAAVAVGGAFENVVLQRIGALIADGVDADVEVRILANQAGEVIDGVGGDILVPTVICLPGSGLLCRVSQDDAGKAIDSSGFAADVCGLRGTEGDSRG